MPVWSIELNATNTFGAVVLLLVMAMSSTWLHSHHQLRRRGLKPLPGPFSIPFIGCVGVPRTYTWRHLAAWRKHYGPIYRVVKGHDTYVVLGTTTAITDLLQHRGSIYSCRPRLIMGNDMAEMGLSILLTPYGSLFRKHRAAMQPALTKPKCARLQGGIDKEVRVLLRDLVKSPLEFRTHVDRYHVSSIVQIIYGFRVPDAKTSPDVQTILEINEHLFAAVRPGHWLVDAFTVIEKLPTWILPTKKTGMQWLLEALDVFKRMLGEVREADRHGAAPDCYGLDIIRSQAEPNGLSDDEAAFVCGSSFSAGSNALTSALLVAMMAFVLFPEAADKARHEIDCLVGSDRLPTHEDLMSLPYTASFIKELMRWRPFVPGGMPHRLTRDDEYMGYHIPKGAFILGNTESSHNDEAVFDEPHAFKPERWLHQGEAEAILDLAHAKDKLMIHPFGFGRRICPGMNLAMRSLGTSIPALLWGFEFAHALDEQGNQIPIDPLAFSDTLSSEPLPFKLTITPRSEERKRVMEEEGWASRVEK